MRPEYRTVAPATPRLESGRAGSHNSAGETTIYAVRFPNGCYIGQTSRPFAKRKREHLRYARNGSHPNPRFSRALLKYGNAVRWEVLAVIPQMWANDEERRQIAANNAMHPHGYNLREGGNVAPMTDAHRAALSAAHTGKKRQPFSEEHIAKLRATLAAVRPSRIGGISKGRFRHHPHPRA